MIPGECLWNKFKAKEDRIFCWEQYDCPEENFEVLCCLDISLKLAQYAKNLSVWYDIKRGKQTRLSVQDFKSTIFKDRSIRALINSFQEWMRQNNLQNGVAYEITVELKKNLIAAMDALHNGIQLNLPQELLLAAFNIQEQLQPRLELIFDMVKWYRTYAKSLVDKEIIQSNELFNRELKYLSGHDRTKQWLSIKDPVQLRKIEMQSDEIIYFRWLFGEAALMRTKMSMLGTRQKITIRFKILQTLIHELDNLLFIYKRALEIHSILPEKFRRYLFLTPDVKVRGGLTKMLSKPKPIVDESRGTQKFRILAVPKDSIT